MKKDELRKKIKNLRQEQSKEEIINKSTKIKETLLNFAPYKNAQVIMSYVDFNNEVLTGPIIKAALQSGKRVVVPISKVETKEIIPSEIKKFPEDLETKTFNILEPRDELVRPVDPKEIDLVLVPGLAFDMLGNRLGYGAGFYDRFLMSLRNDATTIALAFDLQIVDNVYHEEHDIPVHYIITEKRLIKCNSF